MSKETRRTKITRNLKCKLDDERLRELGDIAAFVDSDIEKLESEKKQFTQQNKADLDAAKARRKELLQKIRDKAEYRMTECEEQHDYARGTITIVRNDTFEEVLCRAMNAEERSKTVLPGFEPNPMTLDEAGSLVRDFPKKKNTKVSNVHGNGSSLMKSSNTSQTHDDGAEGGIKFTDEVKPGKKAPKKGRT